MRFSYREKKAFTLVELMLAIGILALVVTGLLMTYVSCILLNETNLNQTRAAAAAQFILERLYGRPYDGIVDEEVFAVDSLRDGEGVVYMDENNGKKEVVVEVTWVERNRDMNFKLFTIFHE